MKKGIGIFAGVFVALLVVLYFVLGLLTNYASISIPSIFENNPVLLWSTIACTLSLIIIISLIQLSPKKPSTIQHSNRKKRSETNMSEYDVFVSYAHEDKDWVMGLLIPFLTRRGFDVYSDLDFSGGSFGVEQMENGVRNSRHVLAVFSPSYFLSEWSKLENIMAQALDPGARNRKLIPVLYQRSAIPLRLSVIQYRDLTQDDDGQWDRLVEDLL